MIAVSELTKFYGRQTLFHDVSLQLKPGDRYGLVGANGSGKSTFLRLLAGEEPPNEGTISVPKRAKLGILRQDQYRYTEEPILEVAMMGNRRVWGAMVAKEELLARADDGFDAGRYAELEETILQHDGYALEARAGEVLEGLGIPTEIHRRPISTLSGGFKLRVLLAQVLTAEPDVLLLDEPTNHLDILSIRWLEKFLTSFKGCVVVISHDHRFLDNVCTHMLDVDYETITLYPGDYTAFMVAKEHERGRREAEIAKQEKQIANYQRFVERFRAKASKARQAQSKQKLMEKMAEGLEPLPQSSRRYPTFDFHQCRPSGKEVVVAEGVSKAFGDNQVLEDVSLTVRRGERVAILGPNGIGKSTLLKILVGQLAADAGRVEWGYETHPGYFAQDHHDILGQQKATVESWLWEACPTETVGFVRSRLGRVLFSKEEVRKSVRNISGGEAARLIFARLSVEQPNVLILDEPTNHLDLEAIEALVGALQDYDGTLIMVSHDRWFVSQLATRILEIRPDGIEDYLGTYQDYVERCGDDHLDAEAVSLRTRRSRGKGKARSQPAADKTRQRQLEVRRDELTAEAERAEERIHAINELYCDPTFFDRTPREEVRTLEREQKELSARVEELLAEWETIEGELEASGGEE
jgi:ATPase subunit of ABC transporter with duplicated ATPase domains